MRGGHWESVPTKGFRLRARIAIRGPGAEKEGGALGGGGAKGRKFIQKSRRGGEHKVEHRVRVP